MENVKSSRPDSVGAGAPEKEEIQVTEEMRLAGAERISRHFYDVSPWPYQVLTLATEVYQAMEHCRLSSLSASRDHLESEGVAMTITPTQSQENQSPNATSYSRSGLCLVPQLRRGLALLNLRGWLCSVELVVADPLCPRRGDLAAASVNRAGILFALAFQSLRLALHSSSAQAKAYLCARPESLTDANLGESVPRNSKRPQWQAPMRSSAAPA